MLNDRSSAWPVANPLFTYASASDSSHLSNFVADLVLYIQEDVLYLFFETKMHTLEQKCTPLHIKCTPDARQ